MKKILILSCLMTAFSSMTISHAQPLEGTNACSLILNAKDNVPSINAKGVALTYPIKRLFSSGKISLSIHAQYLPDPSSRGNYDRYEGFAQVPGVISWRFTLYPVSDYQKDPTWAGRLDEISGPYLENASVQVRLSNSKENTLGPIVLENHMKNCNFQVFR